MSGRARSITARTAKSYDPHDQARPSPDHLEIQGCVLGFLCGGETWTRVAGPIPSSPVNSMAKERTENSHRGALPKPAPAKTSRANDSTRLPRWPVSKPSRQVPAASGRPVGDICLLPDIAGLAHQGRLEQQHRRQCHHEGQRQQLAHARGARMVREPQAAECWWPVVSALKKIARVRARLQQVCVCRRATPSRSRS